MDDLHQIILTLYRAAQEAPVEEFQEFALQTIKQILRFETCRWTANRITPHGVDVKSVYNHNEGPEVNAAYREIAHQDAAAFQVIEHPGTTGNFHFPTFYQARQFAEIRDYAHRLRHKNGLITFSISPSQTGRSLSLYRIGVDDHFTERDRLTCQTIFPHLLEAHAINHSLSLARLHECDGSARWPMAICEANGFVLHAEHDFVALIREQWADFKNIALPQVLVSALAAKGEQQFLAEHVFVVCMQKAKLMFLKARRRLPVDALGARELEVATQVAKGLSFKAIAQQLKLSPATVRNHIQNIHARLQIRSNTELVAQLKAAYPWDSGTKIFRSHKVLEDSA